MEKRTEISTLGEFELIEKIKNQASKYRHQQSHVGIGDDAAVLLEENYYKLVSSDWLIEGVHFDLSYMPLMHLGYKLATVNFSDIFAMNGQPRQLLVNIAMSNRFSTEAIDELYAGIFKACQKYHVDVIGGDTSSSAKGLLLSATAIGQVAKNQLSLRSGAKPNDIICVTGDLGAAYLGLQVLEREKQVYLSNPDMQPDISKYSYCIGRQLKPEAQQNSINDLNDIGVVPTSMIDISDGLASEVLHLCKASNVGATIHEEHLPINAEAMETALEFNISPTTCALNGGEDYELLFTVNQEDYEQVKEIPDIHFIGYITNGKPILHTRGGQDVALQAQGWKHF